MSWRERILRDPAIHHGAPVIAGTRVAVDVIVGSLEDGDSVERIIENYPQLNGADIEAAVAFAGERTAEDAG